MEMADRDTPLIAFGLNYDPGKLKDFILYHHEGKPLIVSIPISDHVLHAQVWHRILADNVHILLLDTNIAENNEERKNVTSKLYDPHFYTRVQQQILLGLGGMQILKVLDIHPTIYHLNEGHTAFGGVAVMVERKEDLSKVVGTKHTILSEAGLHIPRKDFAVLLGAYCKEHGADALEVFEKGKYELDPDIFSTTKFVMNISNRKNSVSALHAVFEKKRHPHSLLIPITNGVYEKRWQAKELLVRDSDISDKDLWTIKRKLRSNLFNYLHENLGKELNPDICTVVWARRFAAYKRPFLLFSDYERIVKLLSNREHPVQFIISGRAHDADEEGKEIVKKITALSDDPATHGKIVYIPNYSLDVARELVRGADIWLNTPERGKEACGTSGMKAALNGSLQCSISDGWVDEVNWGGRGWILPEENTAHVLYDLLEHEILPDFYGTSDGDIPHQWVKKMRSTIELVEKNYTASSMVDRYMKELYFLV
jgi:starch phosphorylase